MANVINTRIQLKYDTLSNWNASTFKPLKGEVCIAKVDVTQPENSLLQPIMFKVGDGDHTFAELGWTSAKAADVYAWAKEATLNINKDGTGNVVAGIEWDATANGGKGGLKYTTASVATSEGLEAVQKAIEDINKELDTFGDIVTHNVAEFQPAGNYKTKQTAVAEKGAANQTLKISQDENGVITTEAVNIAITSAQVTDLDTGVHAVSLASGTNNGTVKLTVDGQATDNIAVTGLGSAAFTASTAYATAAQGATADNAAADIADILDGTQEVKKAAEATQAGHVANKLRVTGGTNYFTSTKEYDGSEEVELDFSTLDSKVKSVSDKADTTASKLDAFLDGVTPDGSADIIDTLAEINKYITSDTNAFTELSGKVTNLENGTTKAGDADKLDGHDSTYFATADALAGVKTTAEAAAPQATTYTKTEVDNKLGAWTIPSPDGEKPPVNATGLRGEIETRLDDINRDLSDDINTINDTLSHIDDGTQVVGQAKKVANKLTVVGGEYVTGVEFDGSAAKTLDLSDLNDKVKAVSDIADTANTNAGDALAELDAFFASNVAGTGDVTYDKIVAKIGAAQTAADTANENIGKLHEIATTGSIYDVAEGANTSTGTDTGVEYLIFNCGSASTII